jgi:hypothetical protein
MAQLWLGYGFPDALTSLDKIVFRSKQIKTIQLFASGRCQKIAKFCFKRVKQGLA